MRALIKSSISASDLLLALAVLIVFCFLMVSGSYASDRDYYFRLAIISIEEDQWKEAIEHLNQVIEEEEMRKVSEAGDDTTIDKDDIIIEEARLVRIYGGFYVPFLPYYYRGLALFNSNEEDKYSRALSDFKRSIRQRALQKHYEELIDSRFDYVPEEYVTRCEDILEKGS